jgi:hypothetical protein
MWCIMPWSWLQLIILVYFKSQLNLVLAYRSLPNKCTPGFTSIIEPYPCEFASAFLQPFCSNGALILVKSIQYPAWCRPLLSHVAMISHVTPCTYSVQSIQENAIFSCTKDQFDLEASHRWKLSASAWNLIKALSIQSIWWDYQTKKIE